MNIIVCIKQVPATTKVETDPQTGTLKRQGVEAVINPLDLHALEAAVLLKERYGGSITAISMGPPPAEAALRNAIAVGVDEAILLSDRTLSGSDTLATAYALAAAIRRVDSFDLIVCGAKTVDGDTAQVGPELAEQLGIPNISFVQRIDGIDDGRITTERVLDETIQLVSVLLPCVLTVTKEASEPRLPNLKSKINSMHATIKLLKASDLDVDHKRIGLNGSPTQVIRVFPPEKRKKGVMFGGLPAEASARLLEQLKKIKQIE
ncbi:electron transfer flavoprotein subunit beta/FixA family protein [Candidatus Micrarchaeota archaeon]|nr:electron transfer flavoprotein subunit beta/FixA family protein [Candidatus Micrarchaeota archaeon]